MNSMSSENVLQLLGEPATLASLAALAAVSIMFARSRSTPLKCPVDPNKQSVEVPVSYETINLRLMPNTSHSFVSY